MLDVSEVSAVIRKELPGVALAAALPLVLVLFLTWPLALHLTDWHLLTTFGDSHVWVFDWVARAVTSGDWSTITCDVGYPRCREARIIGWLPALLVVPFQWALGPVGAANIAQLASLPASGVATYALLRIWTSAGRVNSALLASAYALGPTLLSTLAIGEISNTQGWVFPAVLVALEAVRRRRWLWPLATIVAFVSAFSSPYFGMALPVLAGGIAAWVAFDRTQSAPARFRLAAIGLLAIALGLLPARFYYAPEQSGGRDSIFQPARRGRNQATLPDPSPVAKVDELVRGTSRRAQNAFDINHVAYLGVFLVVAAAWGATRRQKGAGVGAVVTATGVVLACGPYLVWGNDYVRLGGQWVALPVALLEAFDYPTRQGGLYFRFAVLAELGLVVLVASAARPSPRAWVWVGLLTLLHTADAVHDTGPYWPRPAEPVPDYAFFSGIQGDDGAVLELPLQGPKDAALGQEGLLRASLHRRPTTALPRDVFEADIDTERGFDGPHAATLLTTYLRGLGFRYVVVAKAHQQQLTRAQAAWLPLLGPPAYSGWVDVWDLGPTIERPGQSLRGGEN